MLPNLNLIEEVANELGLEPSFVEKDWFVVQVIATLQEISYPENTNIIFSGGTALSKAHEITERFSEDIDFRVKLPTYPSKSKARNERSNFKNLIINNLERGEWQIIRSQVKAKDDNKFFIVPIEYQSQILKSEKLRPHIKLEFFAEDLRMPSIARSVSSFINIISKQAPEVKEISCLNPTESGSDKISALLWRISEQKLGMSRNKDPKSLVRHIYDIAMLERNNFLQGSEFIRLCLKTIEKDQPRLKVELSIKEKLKLVIDELQNNINYEKDYDDFAKAFVYVEKTKLPSFSEIKEILNVLFGNISKELG